jgi:hypothetical protein
MSDKPKNASKKGKKKGKVIVPQNGAALSKKTAKKKFTSSKKVNAGKCQPLCSRAMQRCKIYTSSEMLVFRLHAQKSKTPSM